MGGVGGLDPWLRQHSLVKWVPFGTQARAVSCAPAWHLPGSRGAPTACSSQEPTHSIQARGGRRGREPRKSVCACVCLCLCVLCISVYCCVYVCVFVCTVMCIYVYPPVCVYCARVCMSMCVLCVCVSISCAGYLCVCVYMYVCEPVSVCAVYLYVCACTCVCAQPCLCVWCGVHWGFPGLCFLPGGLRRGTLWLVSPRAHRGVRAWPAVRGSGAASPRAGSGPGFRGLLEGGFVPHM